MTKNEELHAEHQAALAEMRRQQDEELADARLHTAKASQHAVDSLEQELRECIMEAETRETQLRAKHASEVEALSVTHRQQFQQAHSDAAAWQLKLEEGTGLCEQLREQLQLRGEAEADARWRLEESERRAERLETELRQLGTEASASCPHACVRIWLCSL
jgi:chromosome segregation ATPase